jgi:mannosyltransferase OCH1-like enzyme
MIPKTVYQTWYSKKLPVEYEKYVSHNKKLNPEYNFILYNNFEMNQLFESCEDPLIKKAYFKINPKYGSARADFFRYLIIYLKGGIYLDIKIQCLVPFRNWILPISEKGYLSFWDEKYNHLYLKNKFGEIQNWFLIFHPKDPNLYNLLIIMSNNILNAPVDNYGKKAVLMYTGPIIYSEIFLPQSKSYKWIQSSTYLKYNVNKYYDKSIYTHYSQLKENLFLHCCEKIPKRIFIHFTELKQEGLYIFHPYKIYFPLENLIRNCDVFIAFKNQKLYMLGFHSISKPFLKDIFKKLATNEFKITYYQQLCIKQGYINDKDYLMYDYLNYIQFIN